MTKRSSIHLVSVLMVLSAASAVRGATLSVQVDPPEPTVGDTMQLLITVQGGVPDKVRLPAVDGLEVLPEVKISRTSSFSNGALNTVGGAIFQLVAHRPGDFTLPAFDVPLQGGGTLRTEEVKIHVPDNATTPNSLAPSPSPAGAGGSPAPASSPQTGSVILPPPSAGVESMGDNGTPADGSAGAATLSVPRDKDGGPAKVFMLIRPETLDAYVGQSMPLRIMFYIRMEVLADQNSLPTIKGSDFLMSNISARSHASLVVIEGEQYRCDTWLTAVSAPKSGDFPLASEHDTYWVKSVTSSGLDPFGFSRHTDLAHEFISSNQYTIHVHPLPTDGRPENFGGAIGRFEVVGDAQPATVGAGEPVALYYSVAGEGNFDYVRCPVLADDSNWKTYAPRSSISFKDESHTHAVKMFEQPVIPLKRGNVPLPSSTFNYFDPVAKQYVTVPINFPPVTVTGTQVPAAPASPTTATAETVTATPSPENFLPNRVDAGAQRRDLTPAYFQRWFWLVQGGALTLPILAIAGLIFVRRAATSATSDENKARRKTARQEEDAMTRAVSEHDAPAFFRAARHRLQMEFGERWNLQPESITLGEVRRHDPELAASLEPLFHQADEVIYSGRVSREVDLDDWHRTVRRLLEPQPVPV